MAETELARADRQMISRLDEAGIKLHGACGLAWRLRVVDGLEPAEVARILGVAESTVASRVSKVRQKLLKAQDAHCRAQCQCQEADCQEAADERDDGEPDPIWEQARNLLAAVRNQEGEGGGRENPVRCDPLINLASARNIIREGEFARAERREEIHHG